MVNVASPPSETAVDSLDENVQPSDIESLLNAHFGFVWRVLRRMGLCPADADDATQKVFMIASSKLQHIVSGREQAYLYGIAVRVRSHAGRAARRRREAPLEEATLPVSGFTPETHLAVSEARRLLDELLAQLPEKLRRVLVLAEIEGFEVGEIASCEGIPVGTAASRLRLGRERFRGLLAKQSSRNPYGAGS